MFWGRTILVGLKDLAVNLFKGVSPEGISGPIGIYAITTEASKGGVLMLLNFVGILSVNLAILNILPFPALDGGRLLFIGRIAFPDGSLLPGFSPALEIHPCRSAHAPLSREGHIAETPEPRLLSCPGKTGSSFVRVLHALSSPSFSSRSRPAIGIQASIVNETSRAPSMIFARPGVKHVLP